MEGLDAGRLVVGIAFERFGDQELGYDSSGRCDGKSDGTCWEGESFDDTGHIVEHSLLVVDVGFEEL